MQFSTDFPVESVENPPFFAILVCKAVENSVESGENPYFIAISVKLNLGGISHSFCL